MGSKGNEAADELAKKAAEFGSSNDDLLPQFLRRTLPTSLSAVKQQIGDSAKKETKAWWKRSKHYKRINSIDPSLPSLRFISATKELSRKQTSILTQLRTGHIPLNRHLYWINKSASPNCMHCPNLTEDVWPAAFEQREGRFFLERQGVCDRNPLLNRNHHRPLPGPMARHRNRYRLHPPKCHAPPKIHPIVS